MQTYLNSMTKNYTFKRFVDIFARSWRKTSTNTTRKNYCLLRWLAEKNQNKHGIVRIIYFLVQRLFLFYSLSIVSKQLLLTD